MNRDGMIRKKAVLFLHAGAEWYGADKVLFNTITALKEHWECHVLLPNVGILVEKFADLGVTVQVFAYPILRRKHFTLSGIIRFLGEYLIAVLRLFGYVRKHRIHCVCAHTFAVTEGVALALLGVPQVWHVLEIITKPRSLNRFLALAARTTAAKIICASRAVQENLGAPPNSVVIYHGIDPLSEGARPRTLRTGVPVVVGMLGRFNHWKGQDHLVLAVNQLLHRRGASYTIGKAIMVGGVFENDTAALERVVFLIGESLDPDIFEIRGFTEDISSVYDEIDLYVLPSTLPDPFPTVVLEAMSMGIPVVGYRHGGIVEMLDGMSGVLAEPCSTDALAAVIDTALSHEDVYNGMARVCYEKYNASYKLSAFQATVRSVFDGLLMKQKHQHSK